MIAVDEHRHLGRAAHALGISQPPLARRLAALEQELGLHLFERADGGAHTTAAGAAFVEHARRVVATLHTGTVASRQAARAHTDILRIGFNAAAMIDPLPDLVARFRSAHPGVALQLERTSSSVATRALVDGGIDVAVTVGSPRGAGVDGLAGVTLGTDRHLAVMAPGHRLAGSRRARPRAARVGPPDPSRCP